MVTKMLIYSVCQGETMITTASLSNHQVQRVGRTCSLSREYAADGTDVGRRSIPQPALSQHVLYSPWIQLGHSQHQSCPGPKILSICENSTSRHLCGAGAWSLDRCDGELGNHGSDYDQPAGNLAFDPGNERLVSSGHQAL
jgi:hypothetical protein